MNNLTGKPTVSIALATYNGAAYLENQLKSLLTQRNVNFEIVISDDCSTDGTSPLLQRFSEQYSCIRFLPKNSERLGFTANFEYCFANCSGQYISPCDQDDYWHPDKTWKLLAALDGHSLAYCNSQLMSADGIMSSDTMSSNVRMWQGNDPRPFAFGNSASGHAMLFSKELLQRAGKTPHGVFFDHWLGFVAAACSGIAFIDEPLVHYRRHAAAVVAQQASQSKLNSRMAGISAQRQLLKAMANFCSPWQTYFVELSHHYEHWLNSYFSVSNAAYFLRESKNLFAIGQARRPPWQRALKYCLGYRFKPALFPEMYPRFDADII